MRSIAENAIRNPFITKSLLRPPVGRWGRVSAVLPQARVAPRRLCCFHQGMSSPRRIPIPCHSFAEYGTHPDTPFSRSLAVAITHGLPKSLNFSVIVCFVGFNVPLFPLVSPELADQRRVAASRPSSLTVPWVAMGESSSSTVRTPPDFFLRAIPEHVQFFFRACAPSSPARCRTSLPTLGQPARTRFVAQGAFFLCFSACSANNSHPAPSKHFPNSLFRRNSSKGKFRETATLVVWIVWNNNSRSVRQTHFGQ